MKIATHNSATGEEGNGIVSWIVTPFARCQSKSIRRQYLAGCRLFDIRVKYYKEQWVCAHGVWTSRRTAIDILRQINSFEENCGVTITYEGNTDRNGELEKVCLAWRKKFTNISWGPVSLKYGKDATAVKVKYDTCIPADDRFSKSFRAKQGFLPLDGRTWHTFIPIPWLWNKIYTSPHQFDDETYTYVDFL